MREENIDFTDTTAEGFVVVAPGRYKAETLGWQRREKENGNIVHDIDFIITEGEFEGETVRHFQTIMPDRPSSKRRLRRVLDVLRLVTEEDRDSEGRLNAKINYGEKTEWDAFPVESIVVNGKEKSIIGIPVVLQVSNRSSQRNPQEKVHWIDSISPASSSGEEEDDIDEDLPF